MTRRQGSGRGKASKPEPYCQTIALADLVVLEEFQVRAALDERTVEKYRNVLKSGGTFPPIEVAMIDGAFVLVDGWHRVEAMKLTGTLRTEARLTEATQDEARWMAAQANMKHGLPLKSSEVREVFRAYIKAKRHWKGPTATGPFKGYREIEADLFGVKSHVTIRYWMKEDFPTIFEKMSKADEGGKGTGGLVPTKVRFEAVTRDALNETLARYRGIKSPEARGRIIAEFSKALEQMKRESEWTPYVENRDF